MWLSRVVLCVARVQKFAVAQILKISSLLSYSEMVYVHLEWFVYKIMIILRIARNMFTIVCICMPLLITVTTTLNL